MNKVDWEKLAESATEAMINTPEQDSRSICQNCEVKEVAMSDNVAIGRGSPRAACANCRKIYKFDILYSLWRLEKKVKEQEKPFKGTGRKPTAFKRYSQTVKALLDEGCSIRRIAEITGLSTRTVQDIKKELK